MVSYLCCLLLALSPAGPKVTASEVTFPRAELTLRQAVEVLNQSGNRVVDYRSRQGQEVTNPGLRLPTTPLRFWAAVDEVARQARLRVVPFAERNGQTVVALLALTETGTVAQYPVHYDGPFRICLQRVAAIRSWEEGEELSRLLITVQVAWEPRYRPLWLNLPIDGVQQGTTNIPQLKPQSFRVADEAAVTFTVQLPLPPRNEQFIPELFLRTRVVTPPRQTPFVFPTLAEGQQVTEDGVTCTLTRITEEPRQARAWLTLRLHYPEKLLDLESHETWVMQANTLILTPKKGGQPLRFGTNTAEINIQERSGIELRHLIENLPLPLNAYHLRYEAPAPPVKYPLEIRLQNIPLP
jgi:hypothetical protein